MGARAIYQPKPKIPDDLLGQSINTSAKARFRIAADGSAQVDLVKPTDDPRLNRAILSALKQWRFFPAMKNGQPVASTLDIQIPIKVE